MIIEHLFYGVECDRCEIQYEDGEHSYWYDKSNAVENAMEDDWVEHNGKHYCPNCHDVNEETGEVEVYEEYPTHLKTLSRFIDQIASGVFRNVLETETEFTVACRFVKNRQLKPFEEMYIKGLLDEKFISIGYENLFHSRTLPASIVCKITFKK